MTAEDILKENGYTDDQIKAMEPRLMTSFAKVLAEAQKAQAAADARATEAAEIEKKYNQIYANEIVPALNQWGSDKSNLIAERDFYRNQNQGARQAGFIPTEAPGYQAEQPRAANGQYIAGANPVPGSPGMPTNLEKNYMLGISNAMWFDHEWGRLHPGEPVPEDFNFDEFNNQAREQRMSFQDYASRHYKFAETRKELAAKRAAEHEASIRKDERAKADKEYAERSGSNPGLRRAGSSEFAAVRKAVEHGQWKDPVKLPANQRREQTRQMIAEQLANDQSQGNA